MMRALLVVLAISASLFLISCSGAPEADIVESSEETRSTVSMDTVENGYKAIDIMFEYLASHSGEEAEAKLTELQDSIRDEYDIVKKYINIFLVDIYFSESEEKIFDDIDYLEDALDERMPHKN